MGSIVPYLPYNGGYDYGFDIYYSGECFWQKLVFDYGQEIIPKLMNVLKQNAGKGKTFKESLVDAGVDLNKYAQWGLGN